MITRVRLVAMGVTLVLAAAIPLAGHHSFSAEYDVKSPAQIRGKVVKVIWTSPHVYVFLSGEDEAGAAPGVLQLVGWNKETVLPGMEVRVVGYPPKKPGDNIFGSTIFTIISTQRVFETFP